MNFDIAIELARLHFLRGADFVRQLKLLAALPDFHPVEGETGIFSMGGEQSEDYTSLLNAARKAVGLGYTVFILPNPKGIRTADFIFKQKDIYKMYDLKSISGKASVINRLMESVGQTRHVLLNLHTDYGTRKLTSDIKKYFERNSDAIEVLIFKGNKVISVNRRFTQSSRFYAEFKKMYEK